MTKILYAECCGTLVVPSSTDHDPRWCRCAAAACWWTDGRAGRFACYSSLGRKSVSIIGLHNGLLTTPFKTYHDSTTEYGCIQRDAMRQLVDECPASFIFKHVESLVIRIRPEFSNDTFFLPHSSAVPSKDVGYPFWDVVVVVNGQEVKISASGDTQASQLMAQAMDTANCPKEGRGTWILTTSRGYQIDPAHELSYHGILGLGQKLFLNPPPGVEA